MSGPKKTVVKLSEQGIVTEEALTAYLQNRLSPDEKQQLEKLLEEDPFAQDALEGLKSSLNQTAVISSISAINKKVRQRSGLKERKKLQLHWVNYAWAAVVLGLLMGIGFIMVYFLEKNSNSLALNENKQSLSTPVLKPKDTATIYERPQTITTDTAAAYKLRVLDTVAVSVAAGAAVTKRDELKPGVIDDKSVKSKEKEAVKQPAGPIDAMQTKNTFAKEAENKLEAKDDKKANFKSTATADSEKMGYRSADKNVKFTKAEEAPKETKDAAALQEDAMKSFNSGDYNTAADNFDKILKHDPDNPDALYFGGISDYINGKTAKSENNFDKLLKKGNKYIEGSKWYKANILIKKGHSEAAKSLLQDLSNTNGSYKERAIKKLAEMGF